MALYNRGGWLIFSDLLKNWVVKGVASEVNNFTGDASKKLYKSLRKT